MSFTALADRLQNGALPSGRNRSSRLTADVLIFRSGEFPV